MRPLALVCAVALIIIGVLKCEYVAVDVACESDTIGIVCAFNRTDFGSIKSRAFIAGFGPSSHENETVVEIALGNRSMHMPHGIGAQFAKIENLIVFDSLLSRLVREDFRDMPALELLNLFNNKIESIPHDTFHDLPNLRHVDIAHNRISELPPQLFLHTHNLRLFDVSYNQLSKVPHYFFENKRWLWRISFRANQIEIFELDPHQNFMRFKNLTLFDLRDNQGSCDIVHEYYLDPGIQEVVEDGVLELFECALCEKCYKGEEYCRSKGGKCDSDY